MEGSRKSAPRAGAVICHPHPLYGGTLNNKVTFTLARATIEAGAVAVRFNFRGVGSSAGRYDAAQGEVEDLCAVEEWLYTERPGLERWRLGFSFGAAVAIKRSIVNKCDFLVTVSPPVDRFAEYGIEGTPRCKRWLLVQGAEDDVVDPESALEWANRLDPPPQIRIVADAGHFFHGRLNALREIVVPELSATRG